MQPFAEKKAESGLPGNGPKSLPFAALLLPTQAPALMGSRLAMGKA